MGKKEDLTKLWRTRLNSGRRKPKKAGRTGRSEGDTRTEIERDFDRVLFSTPVRRLADKTQVFPLERNDSVRTRLTHSHEVANLARSIGTALVYGYNIADAVPDSKRNIPALLGAVGLVHDLGNPPFGHQGEAAIGTWFEKNRWVLDDCPEKLSDPMKLDFLKFEGNAQTFRLVTKLQILNDDYGLDLTYATLASLMKYTAASDERNSDVAATKKHGYFVSEKDIAREAMLKVGLRLKDRHPLAYIMESCDDIAYAVLDVEDAVKKGLASFSDLIAYLRHHGKGDKLLKHVVDESEKKHKEYRRSAEALSPAELNDISMQRFRVNAIGAMVKAVTEAFLDNERECLQGKCKEPLLQLSRASQLRDMLQGFAKKHAYRHRSVLEVELHGYNVLQELMDLLWVAIVDREVRGDPSSKRIAPFSRYAYARISENYRRIFESPRNAMPLAYREAQLLTDMVSGMTDSFAISLHQELTKYRGEFSIRDFKSSYKTKFQAAS